MHIHVYRHAFTCIACATYIHIHKYSPTSAHKHTHVYPYIHINLHIRILYSSLQVLLSSLQSFSSVAVIVHFNVSVYICMSCSFHFKRMSAITSSSYSLLVAVRQSNCSLRIHLPNVAWLLAISFTDRAFCQFNLPVDSATFFELRFEILFKYQCIKIE